MTEPTNAPQWAITLQFVWGIIGTALVTAIGVVGRWWMNRMEAREKRAREDMLAAEKRRTADHQADIDQLRTVYDAHLANQERLYQERIADTEKHYEARLADYKGAVLRQDMAVTKLTEVVQRHLSIVPETTERAARKRGA